MQNQIYTILACAALIVSAPGCDEDAEGTDLQLYNMAVDGQGHVWYRNSAADLDRSNGSGHNYDHLRTRYNTEAATMLDTNGKVMDGAVFPEGALIVKELYDDPGTVERYAILWKQTGHADADDAGWVWGYVNADATVRTPAADKGDGCVSCHRQSGHIDQTLMNKFFP
jgi:hypothetical protein